ncbi:hypothetical protein MesoLjLc_22250 [Mesorhizobium sp. L-8-10]|nr:hypothetical protein MesoLjLb_22680 [Mesorhizobium sp. L-8-3]BCH30295.1 hypothetical protein MesoLjLc_22250 [Mesorhizobium sp. L-8-10]
MGAALKLIAVPLVASSLVVGCSATTRTANPRGVWCDHNEPRRDATVDTPRIELDQINSHNAKGTRWCGWTP